MRNGRDASDWVTPIWPMDYLSFVSELSLRVKGTYFVHILYISWNGEGPYCNRNAKHAQVHYLYINFLFSPESNYVKQRCFHSRKLGVNIFLLIYGHFTFTFLLFVLTYWISYDACIRLYVRRYWNSVNTKLCEVERIFCRAQEQVT